MKFSKEVEERMLEHWWVINPDTYTKYWQRFCKDVPNTDLQWFPDGSEMLIQLAKDNYEFFYKLYSMR